MCIESGLALSEWADGYGSNRQGDEYPGDRVPSKNGNHHECGQQKAHCEIVGHAASIFQDFLKTNSTISRSDHVLTTVCSVFEVIPRFARNSAKQG